MLNKNLVSKAIIGLALTGLLVACGENASGPPGSNSVPTTVAQSAVTPATTVAASQPATASAKSTVPAPVNNPTTTPPSVKNTTTGLAANPASSNSPDGSIITIRFNEFYAASSTPIDLQLSDKLKAANGKRIKINGYMAPPLKPSLDFFVLTRLKLVVCPFCSTAADWPEDIMLVTMPPGKDIKQTEEPITVIGKLEIGDAVDPQTGFFSLLRLRADSVDVFKAS